jgi:Mn2+/Fe2+ NRAMP family transporter
MVCAEITDAGLIIDAFGLGENEEIRPFQLQSADQAAKALEPLVKSFPYAGHISKAIFALGIIVTGLLAVPVLARSAGYALADRFGWKEGLGKKFKDARSFYLVIAIATLAGLTINFISIDPFKLWYILLL